MKHLITFFLSVVAVSGATFEPDMEVKIKGLVCPSCAIGIKRNFLRYKLQVDAVKFNTLKEVALVDFFENENKRIYWLKNEQIIKLVKDAGYEVTYIKRLDNSKPNRYNAP